MTTGVFLRDFMHLFTIIVIAVGLAIDAFAVSVVSGSAYKQLHVKHAVRMALFFGGFQAIMPLIGFMAGLSVKQYIESCDHWIIFGLLSAVGGNQSNTVGAAGTITAFLTDRHDFRGYEVYQLLQEKSRSAPLYLQNLSFLI